MEVGIRPEFLRPTSAGEGLPVTITRVEDTGRHKIVRAESQGTKLAMLMPEGQSIELGAARLATDPSHVHVYVDSARVEG